MSSRQSNHGLEPKYIATRLYTVRNIANLAVLCPQQDAEVYVLQSVIEHISEMVHSLIEDLEQEF
jgi:hypothetical protein